MTSERYFTHARSVPTYYSDDTTTPFEDIGMGEWTNAQIGDFFEAKQVIDIGSGMEGIARRLYSIFGDSKSAPKVVNLNPQFTDWRMIDVHTDGTTKSVQRSKELDIISGIRDAMELSSEDFDGYMAHRISIAGIVQRLDFEDDYFDVQVSTWAFPLLQFDCGGISSKDWSIEGYQEILRTQRKDGDGRAFLAPIQTHDQKVNVAYRLRSSGLPHQLSFKPATAHGKVAEITAQ